MRKPFIQLLFIIALTLQLTSCITTHQINYLQPAKNFIPAYRDTVFYRDYRLKEGDRLFVQVYSMDEKTNVLFNGAGNSSAQMMAGSGSNDNLDLITYVIQANGSIQFPLVGEVKLMGKTIREAKEILEEAIKPILKVNSVDVRMVSRSFSIIGAGKSGRFPFPREKVNVYQALALAGDLGFYADRSKVKILRVTGKGNEIKTFDIRSKDIINSEFYYLEPDDVIFLQPMNQQFFGVSSFWTAVSTIVTSYSFGVIVYKSFF
ncbi:MAG: polysaccharide biosynthesis/export family protein [Bacteroidota bacterium]|nr:polysaccharide biosynthesis/export family protein [Bacteroidota bacterium]